MPTKILEAKQVKLLKEALMVWGEHFGNAPLKSTTIVEEWKSSGAEELEAKLMELLGVTYSVRKSSKGLRDPRTLTNFLKAYMDIEVDGKILRRYEFSTPYQWYLENRRALPTQATPSEQCVQPVVDLVVSGGSVREVPDTDEREQVTTNDWWFALVLKSYQYPVVQISPTDKKYTFWISKKRFRLTKESYESGTLMLPVSAMQKAAQSLRETSC